MNYVTDNISFCLASAGGTHRQMEDIIHKVTGLLCDKIGER